MAGSAVPAERCPRGSQLAADGLLDDFEDGNKQVSKLGGRDGYWWQTKDPNGSSIDFQPDEGSSSGSELAMHAFGTTVSAADAWGVGLGVSLVSEGVTYDASKYAGIQFRAKVGPNSGRAVRFKVADFNTHKDGGVCSDCWNHFGKDLTLTTEYREYKVMFSDLSQQPGWGAPRPSAVTPAKLIGLDWSIGPGQTFDLWIDDIVFLECK